MIVDMINPNDYIFISDIEIRFQNNWKLVKDTLPQRNHYLHAFSSRNTGHVHRYIYPVFILKSKNKSLFWSQFCLSVNKPLDTSLSTSQKIYKLYIFNFVCAREIKSYMILQLVSRNTIVLSADIVRIIDRCSAVRTKPTIALMQAMSHLILKGKKPFI